MQIAANQQVYGRYASFLRLAVALLAGVAGLAVAAMILITCVDVVGRRLGHPLEGTYDIVEILGAIAIIGRCPIRRPARGTSPSSSCRISFPRAGGSCSPLGSRWSALPFMPF